MCMYCKCNDLIESITTHMVNYKGCISKTAHAGDFSD